MKSELVKYLRMQAIIAAAYNFFIGGMIASLIYHKADFVQTDAMSIAVDLTLTCFLTFAITMPFCRASLRRDKTGGVLTAKTLLGNLLARLYRRPVLMCILSALFSALILFALSVSLFTLLGIKVISFYPYIALKCIFCAVLGAFATCTVIYAGMCA